MTNLLKCELGVYWGAAGSELFMWRSWSSLSASHLCIIKIYQDEKVSFQKLLGVCGMKENYPCLLLLQKEKTEIYKSP